MGNDTTKCYFTGADCLPVTPIFQTEGNVYNSQLCGQYKFFSEDKSFTDHFDKQKTACYLFYHKVTGPKCYLLIPYAAYKMYFEAPESSTYNKCFADFIILTEKDIENWYPKNFKDRIDKFLVLNANKSRYVGQPIYYRQQEIDLAFFIESNSETINKDWQREVVFILNYLRQSGFMYGNPLSELNSLEIANIVNNQIISISLSAQAWEYVTQLQNSLSNNRDVFVSMAFNTNTDATRDAIRHAIINSKFSPEFMDEIIHNKQIVPEMLRLIRECRFLIMDITEPNFGAYYEAGYAQGLGKEVIVTCREDIFNMKDFTCENKPGDNKECRFKTIATKPHFDIAQKQILVWKDADDLIKKLSEWIKYIIG